MSNTNYVPQKYPKLPEEDSTGWVLASEFKARTLEVKGESGSLKVYESNDSQNPENGKYEVGVTSLRDKSFYDVDNLPQLDGTFQAYNIETLGSIWVKAEVEEGSDVETLSITLFDNQ